ncbi:MAG: hypothetical protein WD688_07790 [Candidatus Binatia bacterium]
MSHPVDETKREVFLHGWLPALAAIVVVAVSIVIDLTWPGVHWTQRGGAVVTILGAYVAYRDAKRSFKYINGSMFMNFELPYRPIAVALVVAGTLIWGYGDLVL